jgi:predicted nucleotidyltransferase
MSGKTAYDIREIKRRLEPVFQASGVKSAILFGSHAQGGATDKSDVDLLVDSGLRGLDFMGLVECAREALNREVDMLDAHYLDRGSPIEREANRTGIRIYG